MSWPQITLLCLWFMGLGCIATQHGQPKTGNHNFAVSALAVVIESTLLYFGGFWQ